MDGKLEFPAFSSIDLDSVEAKLDALIGAGNQKIAALETVSEPDWENFIYELDLITDEVNRFISPVRNLNSVMNSEKVRSVYNACLPKLSAWYTDLGQNSQLYNKTLALAESSRMQQLDAAQQKSINDSLQGYRLGGVALKGQEKERYKEIALELSNLGTRFQENILDATKAWDKLLTDESALAGLPQSSLDLAKQAATNNDQEGYRLTLDYPSYHAVMTFADDSELRKEVYTAYLTRASDQGPDPVAERDNAPLIEKIIALRIEKAKLLGFTHYADYSVATKMVKNPDQVIDFIDELAQKARPAAQRDYQQLEAFAREEHGLETLQPWDLGYYLSLIHI